MRAGLPMYDPPELREVVDAWWRGLARAFRREGVPDVPAELDRGIATHALWEAPDLLFAQACGYPMLGPWSQRLQYLATPRYDAPGCDGGNYCSWIVVAAQSKVNTLEELRGSRCSINGRVSHSGYNALRALVAPLARDGRFFGAVVESGSHADSLAQIARGEVDVAAIDCVTYALLSGCRADVVAATRIAGRTASAPGLPFVTRRGAGHELQQRLSAGVARAFADDRLAAVRKALLLAGCDVLTPEAYRCMADMESAALAFGYFEMD